MSTPITLETIAAIRAACAAATPGEWHAIRHPEFGRACYRVDNKADADWGNFGQICYASPEDATLITTARCYLLPLCDALEEREREVERLREELCSMALKENRSSRAHLRSLDREFRMRSQVKRLRAELAQRDGKAGGEDNTP